MGIFGNYKSHISKEQFRIARLNLKKRGLSRLEIDKVEQIFRGDMEESGDQIGIDLKELERGIDWMRKNTASHKISQKAIDIIEEELKKRIK